ncbi:MAG: fumarate hydratase [Deltaproteobacteria bacterium]|nr:fumarate hydratase [Deltaproteobacteria bacterium]
MREINADEIRQTVKELFLKASFTLGDDVLSALRQAQQDEESPVGTEIITRLLENAALANDHRLPICQDTGLATVFVELGQEARVTGAGLRKAIEEGVRQAYEEGYLRKSVCHPLTRKNTGDNTPAVIHLDLVSGDRIKLTAIPKGGGSENMSRLFMLPPSAGWEGAKEKVLHTVSEAGPNPCPPLVVGVALGGSFEIAAREAKRVLLRPLGQANPDPEAADLEKELLAAVNDLGIGPQGLGGRVTALAVHLKIMPCHIASLPLAVNLQCHACRHAEAVL